MEKAGFSVSQRRTIHSPPRHAPNRPKKIEKAPPKRRAIWRMRSCRRWLERSFTSSTWSRSKRRFLGLRLRHMGTRSDDRTDRTDRLLHALCTLAQEREGEHF